MNWLLAFVIAFLTGVLGLFGVGLLGNQNVRWYRISSMEGGSGYYVIGLALAGAVAGFIVGLVVARFVGRDLEGFHFLRGLGASLGTMLLLIGITTFLCWQFAHIPPTLDGRELMIEAEFRLPVGDEKLPDASPGKSSFFLFSLGGHKRLGSSTGELDFAHARRENGRWIVPGKVFLFTGRGLRVLEPGFAGKEVPGFGLSMPSRPGRKFLEWSDWLPRMKSAKEPWPDSEVSYRFRVQPILPEPPPPSQEEIDDKAFAALTPQVALPRWLDFIDRDPSPARYQAIVEQAATRQPELARLIKSPKEKDREHALSIASQLREPSPAVVEAILAEGREIAAGLRRFNTVAADDPAFYDLQMELRSRFNYWKQAWWSAAQITKRDAIPPVQEIFDLAQVRTQGTSMDEIVVNARVILEALRAPAKAETK